MSKWLIPALSLVFLVVPSGVRADDARQFHLGAIAGLNIAGFGGADADGAVVSAVSKLTWRAGVFGSLGLHERVAVRLELALAGKGTAYEDSGAYDGATNLSYVEVPLLLHVEPPLGAKLEASMSKLRVRPYVLAGLSLSYLLGAENEDAGGSAVDVDERIKSLDFGLLVGLGVAAGLGPGALVVEARYDFGLASIAEGPLAGRDLKNRVISLALGYRY